MRHPMTLAVTTLLLAAPALAQAQQAPATPSQTPAPTAPTQRAGTVQDITVAGTTELLANFLRATLTVQPGAALSSVNLRQVEQEVVASGYFKSAVAELRTVGGRDTLSITVTPNPTISTVETTGLTFLPADGFKASVADLLNVAPGATLNSQRIDQAKEALAQNYSSEGYPFAPSISVTQKVNADNTVALTFVVDETAPITRVEVENVSLLPAATVTAIFKPLFDAKRFTPAAYFAAIQQLQQAYDDAGYLQAGADVQGSSLENGVLKIRALEGRISALDLSDLGDPKVTLQSRVGQPLTLAGIQADVRTLSNQTGKPVGFGLQPDPADPSRVTVLFGAADIASGPVKAIAFAGNTLVPTATLQAAISTKVGDVYSPQLAQQDFLALRDAYRKAGYEISTRDAVTFENGTLTFNTREVKIVGYELKWQGNKRTQDRVILRELPAVNRPFSLPEIRTALGSISRLGYVTIVGESATSDPQTPENITYVLTLAEASAGIPVNLGLAYDTVSGLAGEGGYSNPNVFGLGHNFSATVGAQQNQAGQNLIGNLSYTIPWLDLDFADFRTNRTSVSANVGTSVAGNNTLVDKANTALTSGDTLRDYTVRTTGFSVSAGRSITRNLGISAGVGLNYRTYFLEPLQSSEASTYSDDAAKALLTPTNLTTRVNLGLRYDTTNNPEFPSSGVRANLDPAYSFGRSGDNPVNWTDVETGASTYFGVGGTIDKGNGNTAARSVVAVRANAGTIFGNTPAGTGFSVGGGSTPIASKQIRGIADSSEFGANYFTASTEYRYDFNLNTAVTEGVYGVLFADAGDAWNSSEPFSLKYGIGAGVQVNLGFNGARLANLRFDYGYSPQNNRGQFYFRIGNFF
ncbi:BamA/OMP85 family outer membrane protein [Deinococcus puniceus]|uniref:Membrane protein n=1 Tax=Deinococcus puniceus TaxID=1182568 RepID=A0A172T909_9DEIO|nr:POTRA domain-containing protein [Deinococcus puniceus]ANE43427.1 membrane protein [Deinococcus puniceus]